VNIVKKTCLFAITAAGLAAATLHAQVEYVDPSMGGQGFMLEPTRPTVSLPNSMVRVYPVRQDQLDDQIHSFPLTIISHRLGELFWLMPGDGSADAWDHPAAYDQEVETPYYYSARLDDSLIKIEFTPTARCGFRCGQWQGSAISFRHFVHQCRPGKEEFAGRNPRLELRRYQTQRTRPLE
jgi:putative alpha-1,2-mannosidase